MSSERIRILIADDHSIFREGLRKLLEAQSEFDVVGEASSGEELIQLVRQLNPDVLLLDVGMAGKSGLHLLQRLSNGEIRNVSTKILLLTASSDKSDLIRGLMLGAHGVVPRAAASQMLFNGIRAVVAGDMWISRDVVAELVRTLRTRIHAANPDRIGDLTPRERAIVRAVVEGRVNKEIAETFHISEYTVKHHLTRIFDKLGVSNRVELAMFAVNHDLLNQTSTRKAS